MICRCQPDDTIPSLPSQIKTRIFEIAEVSTTQTIQNGHSLFGQLYTKLYPEVLQNSGSVELFVTATWELLGGGKLPGVSDDHVRRILWKDSPISVDRNPPIIVGGTSPALLIYNHPDRALQTILFR